MKSIWNDRGLWAWWGKAPIVFLVPGLVILAVSALLALAASSQSSAADGDGLPIAESLSPLGSNLVRVWGFDAAAQKFRLYDPSAALLSDLTKLKKGQGYWIKVDRGQTVILVKDTYTLFAGWNLVGWLGEAKVYQLQVSRYITATIDDEQADAILSDITLVLQRNDGPGDVATFLQFVRAGGVTTFTIGSGGGIINSNADFDAVIAGPGQVKVVNQINWCGGFIPNVIGCAYVPGNSISVVRHSPTIAEAILWAHELGHNKGLDHRDELDAVMYYAIYINNTKVNVPESNAYQN